MKAGQSQEESPVRQSGPAESANVLVFEVGRHRRPPGEPGRYARREHLCINLLGRFTTTQSRLPRLDVIGCFPFRAALHWTCPVCGGLSTIEESCLPVLMMATDLDCRLRPMLNEGSMIRRAIGDAVAFELRGSVLDPELTFGNTPAPGIIRLRSAWFASNGSAVHGCWRGRSCSLMATLNKTVYGKRMNRSSDWFAS